MCVGDMRQSYVARARFDGRGVRVHVGREMREGARGVRERPFLAIERGSAGFPENLAAAHMDCMRLMVSELRESYASIDHQFIIPYCS